MATYITHQRPAPLAGAAGIDADACRGVPDLVHTLCFGTARGRADREDVNRSGVSPQGRRAECGLHVLPSNRRSEDGAGECRVSMGSSPGEIASPAPGRRTINHARLALAEVAGRTASPPAVIPLPTDEPTMGGPVTGLLFGMDDVLCDATCWRRWLLHVLSHMGVHTNYRSFFRVWDRDYLVEAHRGRRTFCEAFVSFLRSVGLSPAQIDEVRAACQRRREELEADVRPLPGVRSTLGRLHREGIALGVLIDSEHPHEEIEARLDRLGIGGLFSAVISSFDLGHTKSEPHGYHAALRAMGRPAEQVAFVDHDAEGLAGAKQARMTTVAFNFDPDARADVYLTRFDQLLELVRQASRLAAAG